MGAPRRKNLLATRRRKDDDGDEESLPVVPDDSSSTPSVPSDVDDDADAEGSDGSDTTPAKRNGVKQQDGDKTVPLKSEQVGAAAAVNGPSFATNMADTETMINGLKISDNATEAEAIEFDDAREESAGPVDAEVHPSNLPAEGGESGLDRKRKEHEEYKKRRDADPAFVPNRGGFFMHDHRPSVPGQNGFRPSGRGGRGRGRGGMAPSFHPAPNGVNATPADARWDHDLHESVAVPEPPKTELPKAMPPTAPAHAPAQQHRLPLPPQQTPAPNRSFSCTQRVGTVQVRVFVQGMTEPKIISGMAVNQHTRLPHHRPPLRRDKPVRISLPEHSPRYLFPAMDRSFIFIPRAMRPNQQGFGRGRGRGSFGGFGGYQSGRNSLYGGSAYSPSVGPSRRSSFARDIGHENRHSPAGSMSSRQHHVGPGGKPVVRLPPPGDPSLPPVPGQRPSYSGTPQPIVNLPQPQAYPLPAKPPTPSWASAAGVPMHQPRPQKQVSLADIEPPAAGANLSYPPPVQQHQLPFHQQVPAAVAHNSGLPPGFAPAPAPMDMSASHSRRPSHPSHHGTPLSQIPERAIHAATFTPFAYSQPAPQAFYPVQYAGPVYYYPPPPPPPPPPLHSQPSPTGAPPPPMTGAPFVPGQPYPFVVPAAAPTSMPSEATSQPGTVAHESNGMVYYYDSSQLSAAPAEGEPVTVYPPVAYPAPAGYMVPPSAVYYPPQ